MGNSCRCFNFSESDKEIKTVKGLDRIPTGKLK